MASKKKEPKKGAKKNKKGKGKKPKLSKKAELKAPPKKGASKKKSGKKQKKGSDGPPEGVIDLSGVMITEVVRKRICRNLDLSPRETGYLVKVITSIWMSVSIVQEDPLSCSDSPLMPARTAGAREVDLATLAKVFYFSEFQDEVRSVLRHARRASFVGPKGLAVLGRFVAKANEVVTTDATLD